MQTTDTHISNLLLENGVLKNRELQEITTEKKQSKKIVFAVPSFIYPGTDLEKIALNNGNVFPPNFSWNTYYESPKAALFRNSYSAYVPYFENPELPLESILSFVQKYNIEHFMVAYLKSQIQGLYRRTKEMNTISDFINILIKILKRSIILPLLFFKYIRNSKKN